jgi:hypothetical protein
MVRLLLALSLLLAGCAGKQGTASLSKPEIRILHNTLADRLAEIERPYTLRYLTSGPFPTHYVDEVDGDQYELRWFYFAILYIDDERASIAFIDPGRHRYYNQSIRFSYDLYIRKLKGSGDMGWDGWDSGRSPREDEFMGMGREAKVTIKLEIRRIKEEDIPRIVGADDVRKLIFNSDIVARDELRITLDCLQCVA